MQIGALVYTQLFDAPEVDGAGASVGAVNLVALVEQEFSQIGAVLASNAGDDCCLDNSIHPF
jgi:hypothetical protein